MAIKFERKILVYVKTLSEEQKVVDVLQRFNIPVIWYPGRSQHTRTFVIDVDTDPNFLNELFDACLYSVKSN